MARGGGRGPRGPSTGGVLTQQRHLSNALIGCIVPLEPYLKGAKGQNLPFHLSARLDFTSNRESPDSSRVPQTPDWTARAEFDMLIVTDTSLRCPKPQSRREEQKLKRYAQLARLIATKLKNSLAREKKKESSYLPPSK